MLQICELHRLYRIQKIMMRNIESSRPNERNQELRRYSRPSQSNPARDMQQKSIVKLDCVAESNADRIVEESEIQLTLGPASYDTRKKPETPPLSSDSGPGRSSTSTGSSHLNRTEREEVRGCELGLFQVPGMAMRMGYQNESSGVEEQLRQERLKQPPWLCQVLSLNMA